MVGGVATTASVAGALVPPLMPGVVTVISTDATVAIAAAGTVADRLPFAFSVVVSVVLPQLIVDVVRNPVPETVSVNAGDPATTEDGERP